MDNSFSGDAISLTSLSLDSIGRLLSGFLNLYNKDKYFSSSFKKACFPFRQ